MKWPQCNLTILFRISPRLINACFQNQNIVSESMFNHIATTSTLKRKILPLTRFSGSMTLFDYEVAILK